MISMAFPISKRRENLILYMVNPLFIYKNNNSKKKKKEKQKGDVEWLLEGIKQNK